MHDFRFPPEDDSDPAKYCGSIAPWLVAAGLVIVIGVLIWFVP